MGVLACPGRHFLGLDLLRSLFTSRGVGTEPHSRLNCARYFLWSPSLVCNLAVWMRKPSLSASALFASHPRPSLFFISFLILTSFEQLPLPFEPNCRCFLWEGGFQSRGPATPAVCGAKGQEAAEQRPDVESRSRGWVFTPKFLPHLSSHLQPEPLPPCLVIGWRQVVGASIALGLLMSTGDEGRGFEVVK